MPSDYHQVTIALADINSCQFMPRGPVQSMAMVNGNGHDHGMHQHHASHITHEITPRDGGDGLRWRWRWRRTDEFCSFSLKYLSGRRARFRASGQRMSGRRTGGHASYKSPKLSTRTEKDLPVDTT
jgi:hypothetical protein